MRVCDFLLLILLVHFARPEPKLFYRDCSSGSTAVEFSKSGTTYTATSKRPPNLIIYSTNENVLGLSNEKWTITTKSASTTSASAYNGIYYLGNRKDCTSASKWWNFPASANYKFSYNYAVFFVASVEAQLNSMNLFYSFFFFFLFFPAPLLFSLENNKYMSNYSSVRKLLFECRTAQIVHPERQIWIHYRQDCGNLG